MIANYAMYFKIVISVTCQVFAFVFNDLPVLKHPELSQIVKIKVGDLLPDVAADYALASPYDVAGVLKDLLIDGYVR